MTDLVGAPRCSAEAARIARPSSRSMALLYCALCLSAAARAAAQEAVGRTVVGEELYRGWKYFQVYCSRCHGDDALGSTVAPDLRHSLSAEGGITADSFKVVVRRGSTGRSTSPDQRMRGFEDLLEPALVDAVYAYVRARSDGTLAPGRPRRATPP
jgi:mono/diheme cytochrome c family protein